MKLSYDADNQEIFANDSIADDETPPVISDVPGKYALDADGYASIYDVKDGVAVGEFWLANGHCTSSEWSLDGRSKYQGHPRIVCKYRDTVPQPEPKPKSRPWSRPEDVPEGCVISHPSLNCPLPPASFNELVGVRFRRENGGSIVIPFQRFYDKGTYSTDGREWRKCEVSE